MKYIILFLLMVQTIGCTSENTTSTEFKTVVFEVNYDLLSPIPVSINEIFKMRIPVDYNILDDSKIETFKGIIESDSSAFLKLSLQNVFNTKNEQYLLISNIISDINVFDELDSTYYELLIDNFKTNNIKIGKIKINGIDAIQYLITTNNNVVIKLILRFDDSYYQIDYIIPYKIYDKELKGIESSIGSILELKKDNK